MEFKVRFSSPEGNTVDMESEELGLQGLDAMRQNLGALDIKVSNEQIVGVVPELREGTIEGVLTENEARKTGYFKKTNTIYVEVPERAFNRYTYRGVGVEWDDGTGIECVNTTFLVDTVKIVNAWRDAGYPLVWGFNKEEKRNNGI